MKKLIIVFFILIAVSGWTQIIPHDAAIGFQLGYSFPKQNKFEVGCNMYWSSEEIKSSNLYAMYGPYFSLTTISNLDMFHVGEQIGFNFHLYNYDRPGFTRFRISPSFENNYDSDMRIGTDVGFSVLGLFFYYGYYIPVTKHEVPDISRSRLGVRFVFNLSNWKNVGWP